MRRGKSQKTPEAPPAPAAVSGRPAEVTKTEAIRLLIEEWTQEGRECLPKALTEELKRRYPAQQWTLPYVYSIKSKLKKKRPPQDPPVFPPGQTGSVIAHIGKLILGIDRLVVLGRRSAKPDRRSSSVP